MLEQLLNHIQRHKLCKTSDKILLAVSGGIDSVVMFHLFREAGFGIAVAHCNFQLRGEASLQDEYLVNEMCVSSGIRFFRKRFETEKIANESGRSVQVTARDLRYSFFEELCATEGFDLIATAHNANDNLESVLFNLTRGTGIDGVSGIPVRNGRIIRPLLFASRQSILDYAAFRRLQWREDASNDSDDYTRNFIRHQVIPRLKEINPALEETAARSIERIAGAKSFFQRSLDNLRKEVVKEENTRTVINLPLLDATDHPAVILWELLKAKGFNYEQCIDILKNHNPGNIFYSDKFRLTVDRHSLIIEERNLESDIPVVIEENKDDSAYFGLKKILIRYHTDFKEKIPADPMRAFMDADKVNFPLIWRNWEPGDFIMPLGMNHHKKISDMLIDLKVPVPDKRHITVIQSGRDIVWLVGIRIHEHYKVTEKTRRVMELVYSQV